MVGASCQSWEAHAAGIFTAYMFVCEQKPEYFLLDQTTDAIHNERQVAMCSRAASIHFSASFLLQSILAMSRMNISGTAELGEGLVTLQVAPSQLHLDLLITPGLGPASPGPPAPRSSKRSILVRFQCIHRRHPMSCQDATHAMGNIQRVMLITPGARGDLRRGRPASWQASCQAKSWSSWQSAVPEPAVPEPAVPEPAVPEPAVPEPAVPQPAVPELAGPEPAKPVIVEKADSSSASGSSSDSAKPASPNEASNAELIVAKAARIPAEFCLRGPGLASTQLYGRG